MIRFFPRNITFAGGVVAFSVCVSVPLASCASPPERGYEIPNSLCGIALPQKSYSSLFGPGKEIRRVDHEEKPGSPGMGMQGCQYFVDEKLTVKVSGEWVQRHDEAAPSTPQERIKDHNTPEQPREYAGAYDAATWTAGGVAVFDCPGPHGDPRERYSRLVLDIYANDTPLNDDPDRAHRVFGKLTQQAMAEVVKKLPCQGE